MELFTSRYYRRIVTFLGVITLVLFFISGCDLPELDALTEYVGSSPTVEKTSTHTFSATPKPTPIKTSCTHGSTQIENQKEATCLENGYSGDRYCSVCNELLQKGSVLYAIGHNTEIRNQKQATTTSEGYTGDTYCKTCGVKTATGKTIDKLQNNTQESTNSSIVYTTKTGKKYHLRTSCTGLNNAKTIYESTLSSAKSRGLTPCSICCK